MTLAAAIGAMLAVFAVGTTTNVVAVMLPPRRDGGGAVNVTRALGVVLTALPLGLPFVLDAPPFFRAIVAQALIVESWRVCEILRTPARYPRAERAARIVLLPFEFKFLERIPRRWPVRDLAVSTVLLGVGVSGIVYASTLAPAVAPYASAGWQRWLGTTVAAYVLMEGATLQWVSVLPPFGWRHRPYQKHPILSRSLAEFWGVRWSSVVHEYLRSNVYQPLARRRAPRAGIVAAFFVSAILHGYLVWPAAGAIPALWMLSFFLVHGVGMVIEARLRIRRWPALAARAFVVVFFLATVPLFIEPILRAVGL